MGLVRELGGAVRVFVVFFSFFYIKYGGFRPREVFQGLHSDIPHLFPLSRGPDLNYGLHF